MLNDVCQAMASRLGRPDGAYISGNKGRVLLEVGGTMNIACSLILRDVSIDTSTGFLRRCIISWCSKNLKHERKLLELMLQQ